MAARISGSGKWVEISYGRLQFGDKADGSAQIWATPGISQTFRGVSYKGLSLDFLNQLKLTGVSELSIADCQGYTGTIPMCNIFSYSGNALIWDPQTDNINNVRTVFFQCRFEKGILVSVT